MSEVAKLCEHWMSEVDDGEILHKLRGTQGNKGEIEDCFYQNLTFRTGGLRGELSEGTNRMNIYTVRKASQGLSTCVLRCWFEDDTEIVIRPSGTEPKLKMCVMTIGDTYETSCWKADNLVEKLKKWIFARTKD